MAKKRGALGLEMIRLKAARTGNDQRTKETKTSHGETPWSVTPGDGGSPNSQVQQRAALPRARAIALELVAYRAGLANTYGSLYRSLGLSTAKIEQFEDSMTEYAEARLDLRAVVAADGLAGRSPEIQEIKSEADENLRVEQIDLLGDAGYEQLQQFERVLPVRNFAIGVPRFSGYPPEPLTETQTQQLTAILAGASKSYQTGGLATPDTVDWNTVLVQAHGILTEAQFEGLKTGIGQADLDGMRARFFQGDLGSKSTAQ